MDGLLNVTDQSVIAVVCRVTYNSSQLSTFFYLANTRLSGSTAFEADSTVRVSYYQQCYQPPSQDNCEELTLVLRVSPQLNNTVITCRSRPRDSTTMTQSRSQERITVVLKDPGTDTLRQIFCFMYTLIVVHNTCTVGTCTCTCVRVCTCYNVCENMPTCIYMY